MKVTHKIILILGILIFSYTNLFSQSDVYLKIYTKTFQRMEIDLYPFMGSSDQDSDQITGLITEVLSNDLWMSGYFKVNIKTGMPDREARAKPSSDGMTSALAWVSGRFAARGDQITIQPEVVDKASGKTIIKSNYTEQLQNQRYVIHKIADDIVYKLTGERGIATSKMAFVNHRKEGKEIALMDYDGHNMRILTRDKSINISPAWSPDGTQICYTGFQKDNPDLYIYNLRTSTQYRISNVQGLNSAPSWSPDGNQLALTLTKDGNAEIYILDIGKKKFRRLTYNRAIDTSPTWSPSNREIAFTSDRSGSPQIYIMDSDGLNIRRLTFQGNYNESPDWSPRGDKIAYVSRTASGFDIYTIDATGENMMRLTDSSGSNESPSWSPNGFALVFSSTRSGGKELYSMFWDGSDQKKLTTGGNNYSPAWSPKLN